MEGSERSKNLRIRIHNSGFKAIKFWLYLNYKELKGRYIPARLWIEKTNVLVDNGTDISGFRESPGATEIGNAVRKKSPAGIETAIRVFETQPRRERDPDRDRDPKLPPSPP
jgi:hypothetical protein